MRVSRRPVDTTGGGVHGFSQRRVDMEALSNSFVRRAQIKRQHEFVDEFARVRSDDCGP